MSARDTTPDAAAFQVALYRQMSPERRCAIAARMSSAARAVTLEGIRSRHSNYDAQEAKLALFRLLLGDDLFRRAWPGAPMLEP